MRLIYFANNWLGWQALVWLRQGRLPADADVVGLVLHPAHKRRFGDELLAAAGLPPERVFTGDQLRDPAVLARIQALDADLGLSVLFDHILKPELLALFPRGVVNLHPALLPWNRGQYPNVWSIVEGTPAGTTLHYIDAGIDTGDIIAQREVVVDPADTGESLYRKLERASLALLQETWPALAAGTAGRRTQPPGGGSYHRTRDVDRIDEIDLDRSYTGRALIDLLRARSFPPYTGAWFRAGGRKIHLRLTLEPEDEAAGGPQGGG
jgi:methionyl-tRNA formyltransferase